MAGAASRTRGTTTATVARPCAEGGGNPKGVPACGGDQSRRYTSDVVTVIGRFGSTSPREARRPQGRRSVEGPPAGPAPKGPFHHPPKVSWCGPQGPGEPCGASRVFVSRKPQNAPVGRTCGSAGLASLATQKTPQAARCFGPDGRRRSPSSSHSGRARSIRSRAAARAGSPQEPRSRSWPKTLRHHSSQVNLAQAASRLRSQAAADRSGRAQRIGLARGEG